MSRRTAWSLLLLGVFSSCLWRGYARVMSIHVDVLVGMVDKIAWQADTGRQPAPNDVTELLYPLARARDFARRCEVADAPPSLRLFDVLLRRYDVFARRVDRTRADADAWRRARATLLRRAIKLRRIAARVRAQLRREAG